MDWVETTGRTVDEAKEAALDQLGVHDSDAEFVVVSEPRAGLFGRMRGEARVRARVKPTSPRPKRGRSRRSGPEQRRQGGRQGRSSRVAVADAGEGEDAEAEGSSANGNGRPASSDSSGTGTRTGANRRRRSRGGRGTGGGGAGGGKGQGAGASGTGETSDGERQDSDRPGGQRPQGDGGGRQGPKSGRRPRPAAENKEEFVGEAMTLEEQGESARQFIEGLVRELGLSAEVSVRVLDEDTAQVAVDGAELGVLIGPGGATLGALQELARTVVQQRTGGQSDRILVDVAGYRAKRADALQRFSRQVVEEVLASGTERALEPMSAADRKVVHDTVNEIDGVSTRSEGEDPRRHIVISATRGGGAETNDA
ncbi:MAG TPA: RNA-binding cell elongation regulator Jag/EloR [Acidimicrobiales bacterium]|nr:RNA-binding cell elongation regulator Jag/EloR [Acidimicrobiales bacterium]